MSVKCGNGTISIGTIVSQCCRKPNKLQGWHVIEIKNVLPTNSSVKENQLFGFAVASQSDIDTATSLEMPEYSFMNYLANSKELYKFADDCLNDALQKKQQPVYNLLLYKLDTAEEVAPNKLRVRAEKCLHCAILTYEIVNQVDECSGNRDRSGQQRVTNEETNDEHTVSVDQEERSSNASPQRLIEQKQLSSRKDTEMNLCTDSEYNSSAVRASTSKSVTDNEQLDCVINTEYGAVTEHISDESSVSCGKDISSRPEEACETATKPHEDKEKCVEYVNIKETSVSRKRKMDRPTDSSTERIKKYTKRKKETKMTSGMTTLGSELSLKDMLDMGTGFPGLKIFGTSNTYDDEIRINSSNILSEKFDKLKNANEVAENGDISQRDELEQLDKALLSENIENRKEVPNVHIHVTIDSMRYKKMGLPPPPPMPQSLIDRCYEDTKAKSLGDMEPMLDRSNFEIKPPKFSKEAKEKMSNKYKGYEDGILALQKTIDDGKSCDADQERKLQEIKKTLQAWKEKAAEDEMDEETKRKMMAVTDYVQQILRTKLALKDHKNETTPETEGITEVNVSTDTTSGPERSGWNKGGKVAEKESFKEVLEKTEEKNATEIAKTVRSQVEQNEAKAVSSEVSYDRKQKEGNKKDGKDTEIHSTGGPSMKNELQNSSKVKSSTESSQQRKLVNETSHRSGKSSKDSKKPCGKTMYHHDEGQERTCKQGKEPESVERKDKNSKDGKNKTHSASSRNESEKKSRRNDKNHAKECSQRSHKHKEKRSAQVKESSRENKKVSKDTEIEKKSEKENKLSDGVSCEAKMNETGKNCTNVAEKIEPSNVTVNLAGKKENVSVTAEALIGNESMMTGTDDANEHGEADMSLDESFDASTSNIQLQSILDIDVSQRQQPLLYQGGNGNKGAGQKNYNEKTVEEDPPLPTDTFEQPPLPEGPPPEMPEKPPSPPPDGLVDQFGNFEELRMQAYLYAKHRDNTQQDKPVKLQDDSGSVSKGDGDDRAGEHLVSSNTQKETHFQNKNKLKKTHRRGSATERRGRDFQDTTKEKNAGEKKAKSSEGAKKDMNKPTKPETKGQFHGRTLLMGKKVPPRHVPLEPLYISKPYTTSGKKQIRPVDPRPKYYSTGGLERRIIKQMQEEAQKMIEKALGKVEEEKLFEQNSDFEVHKVDVRLDNPFQNLVDNSNESRETASGPQSLNTIGEELEKRLHTQVQVAYKKLLEQGVPPVAIVERMSTTLPTETSSDLDDPRIISDRKSRSLSNNSDMTSESSGGNVTDPWTSPVRECEESKKKERAQIRKEAERQLKIVERRLSELQEENYSGKEDGEVSNDSDGLEKKGDQNNSHQKSRYTYKETGGFSPGDDVFDPWESTFQGESNPPEPTGRDPWSSTPISRSAFQNYDDNYRVRNSYHSGARYFSAESYSSGMDNFEPPWTYRSHSPRYEGYRSNSSHDKQYHSSSRSPEYRYHYDRYGSPEPERRRYRSRSRSPDYRRHGSSKSSRKIYRHKRRRSRHQDSPGTTHHRRHGSHRRKKKSRSRSPMMHDPWEKKEEHVTVHIVNESDDDVTFQGMSPANEEGRDLNKPGERKVERVKKNGELCRSVKRIKSNQSSGEVKMYTGFGLDSVLNLHLAAEGHPAVNMAQNVNHEGDGLVPRIVVMDEIKTISENSLKDRRDIFQDTDRKAAKIEIDWGSQQRYQSERKKPSCGEFDSDRDITHNSSSRVVTFIDANNTSVTKKTPGSLKNNDSWKYEATKIASCDKRQSVFSRLGNKEIRPAFNRQKVPPMQRLEEIRNEAVYTDDTFGDINTSFSLLENF